MNITKIIEDSIKKGQGTKEQPIKIPKTLKYPILLSISAKGIKDSMKYAFKKCQEGEQQHRNHRSGGSKQRNKSEIFADAFRGKIAETGFREFILKTKISCSPVNYSISEKGQYEVIDFVITHNNKQHSFNIKSSKIGANLCLLETKDYHTGAYKVEDGSETPYQFIAFLKVKFNDFEPEKFILNYKNWEDIEEYLKNNLLNIKCYYCGKCSWLKVQETIKNQNNDESYLKKNTYFKIINSKSNSIKMDTSNFFIHLDDFEIKN